jgi:hypothetical protein
MRRMNSHLRRKARTPSRRSNSVSISLGGIGGRDFLFATGAFDNEARALDFAATRSLRGFAMRMLVRSSIVTAGLAGFVVLVGAEAAAQGAAEIATYRNQRYGFSISYPTAQFRPREPLSEEGRVWISHDGNSRLLAGALPNTENLSLSDYREFILQNSYSGASVDYAPIRDNWFVVSGVRDGVTFYERVTFTCGGRLIKSWAMVYPEAEKRIYDRIVEQVARSYRAGDGNCS